MHFNIFILFQILFALQVFVVFSVPSCETLLHFLVHNYIAYQWNVFVNSGGHICLSQKQQTVGYYVPEISVTQTEQAIPRLLNILSNARLTMFAIVLLF